MKINFKYHAVFANNVSYFLCSCKRPDDTAIVSGLFLTMHFLEALWLLTVIPSVDIQKRYQAVWILFCVWVKMSSPVLVAKDGVSVEGRRLLMNFEFLSNCLLRRTMSDHELLGVYLSNGLGRPQRRGRLFTFKIRVFCLVVRTSHFLYLGIFYKNR
jgi:hypothetical protein